MVSNIRPASPRIHDRVAPPGAPATPAPTPQAPSDAVSLSGAPEAAEPAPSLLPLASRAALAAFAAVGIFGAFAGHAAAAPPSSQSAPAQAGPARLEVQPEVVRSVRTYVKDMLENNRIQSETLNTYDKVFQNNLNTLQRIELRILQNPSSLNDKAVRRTYEKVQAALDSLQVYQDVREGRIYRAATMTIETADGSKITMPMEPVERTFETRRDYSGSARMTDATMESLRQINR